MKQVRSGGGWPAVFYTFRKAREAGGLWKFYKALRSKNACKTCAVGMGGQRGGMINEAGKFPEVCKKAMQAMAADMQGGVKPEFFAGYSVPQLQRFTPRELETAGRLTQPVLHRRGENFYSPLSWEEALQRVSDKLREIAPDESFFYFSGRSSNEAGFLLQLFARVYGTNNVNNCSYYCHQASGVGLSSATGSGTATVTLEDVERADLVFVIGGNPASNHPRLMTLLKDLRRRGGEVVVINPVIETGLVNFRVPSDVRSLLFGSRIASHYVQPDIGGDLALLYGLMKRIDELGAVDQAMLDEHCEGWPELAARLRDLSWEEIDRKSGVDREQLERIAELYARSRNAVFTWTMGITHHAHGVENVQAIANLALMRGMVGRPGAGLLPIRGHSNVQGIGSMGVTPKLKQAVFDRLQEHFGLQLPTTAGRDTLACIDGANRGELKAGICLGGNLYGSNPDSAYAEQAIGKLEQIVYLSTSLNTGHARGLAGETIILPVLARDEEPQPTTQESMFNFIRLSDGGPARHVGPKSEVEVIASLAERTLAGRASGGAIDWPAMRQTGRIREAIAAIVPGFEPLAEIDRTGREFHVPGRILHRPEFPTENGRAKLHVHDLPESELEAGRLRLMTVRSEGQFNTVVYEEYDLYRGIERRDVILIHPDDCRRLGLEQDQAVTVRSATGAMPNILVRPWDRIKPGNALMYYPEANVLVSRTIDPQSRTPAFKDVRIAIEPAATRSEHSLQSQTG